MDSNLDISASLLEESTSLGTGGLAATYHGHNGLPSTNRICEAGDKILLNQVPRMNAAPDADRSDFQRC
jgi:hypothetical protein